VIGNKYLLKCIFAIELQNIKGQHENTIVLRVWNGVPVEKALLVFSTDFVPFNERCEIDVI
jgi:hypothetical protein